MALALYLAAICAVPMALAIGITADIVRANRALAQGGPPA